MIVNLEQALRRLRARKPLALIWIDALCIDQRNVGERVDQVLRMRNIYSKATFVIAWIGEEIKGTAAAVSFLGSMPEAMLPKALGPATK